MYDDTNDEELAPIALDALRWYGVCKRALDEIGMTATRYTPDEIAFARERCDKARAELEAVAHSITGRDQETAAQVPKARSLAEHEAIVEAAYERGVAIGARCQALGGK
jgi:hypothetical protein